MWSLRISRGSPTNPVPSFMQCRPYLDTLRAAILHHLFRNVLVVVHSKGAVHISIFRVGYLLACFYLLLFSTTLLQKDTCTCLLLWDGLLLYNITISKNMLLFLSYIFMKQMQSNCCFVALYALSKATMIPRRCCAGTRMPVEEAGTLPDRVCFPFLLLEHAFLSHDSLHIRAELQVSAL